MTDLNQLPVHVRQAMQRVADVAGTSIEFVDPAPFADLPEPEDNSDIGRMFRNRQAYDAEAAANRAEAELAELKRVAAADLPGKEEIAEMARSYGISGELLLAQYTEKKTAAQEALNARQKTIEATRREAELLRMAVEFGKAKDERDLHALIKIGGDVKNPGHQEARRVVAGILPGWDTWG